MDQVDVDARRLVLGDKKVFNLSSCSKAEG
jgi:hypothetical protein